MLSFRNLTKRGFKVEFTEKECLLKKNEQVIATGNAEGNLNKLNIAIEEGNVNITGHKITKDCIHEWH